MDKCYCGIDPGLNGAISFIFIDNLLTVQDILIVPMPIIKFTKAGVHETKLNFKDIDTIFKEFKDRIITATIEKQQAMRTQIFGKDDITGKSILLEERVQGTASTFKIGEGYGALKMCLLSNGVNYFTVGAQKWQKCVFPMVRNSGTKKTSIERAKELYPNVSLKRNERERTDKDGMSDSLLIAHYTMLQDQAKGGMCLWER